MKLNRNNKWMTAALSALMLTSVNAAEHGGDEARHRVKEGTRHDEAGGYINADFIYWAVDQGGLDYQYNSQVVGGVQGNYEVLDITRDKSWKPGFKVGIGMNTPHDNWGVHAQYTWLWFDSSDNQMRHDATNGQLCLWSNGQGLALDNYEAGGYAQWRMKFNDVFLSLNRSIYRHAKTHFQGEFGLRAAWNDQTVEVVQGAAAGNQTDRHTARQEFSSIGWRAASDCTWSFTEDNSFSFFSDFVLSLLAAKWDEHRWYDAAVTAGGALTDTALRGRATHYGIQPVVDINAGLRWQTTLDSADEDAYGFMIQAGWETQYWHENNKLIGWNDVEATDHNGSLSFSGLSLRAQFDW